MFYLYDTLSPEFCAFTTALTNTYVPIFIQEAFNDPKWKTAVLGDMSILERNGTWKIRELPKGTKIVGCKWVFIIKFNADGIINRHKARLVAKGFTQTHGNDYQETFAAVTTLNTIRVLLSLASNLDWPL